LNDFNNVLISKTTLTLKLYVNRYRTIDKTTMDYYYPNTKEKNYGLSLYDYKNYFFNL